MIEKQVELECLYPLCPEAVAKSKIPVDSGFDILGCRRLYCSKRCMALNKFYASQLSLEPFYLRAFETNVIVFPVAKSQESEADPLVGYVKV